MVITPVLNYIACYIAQGDGESKVFLVVRHFCFASFSYEKLWFKCKLP